MTRLDQPSQAQPVDRAEIKKIMRRELFVEVFRRKALGCAAYLLVLLVVTGVPAALIASAAAKSGFFDVPVFSRWLYEPSAPTRVVRPYDGTTNADVLASIGRHAQYDLRTGLATVPVSETELTTLLAGTVATAPAGSLPFPVRSAQVVVEPRVIEVFATSPQGERDATVFARLTPTVSGGTLGFEVRELRLGSLNVPKSLAQMSAGLFTRFVTGAVSAEIDAAGTLVNVEAGIGELRFILTPDAAGPR